MSSLAAGSSSTASTTPDSCLTLYLELLFSCKRCEYNTKLVANGNMCQCGRVVTLWTPKTPAPWASSPTTSTSAPLAEDEFSMQGYQNVQNQGVIAMANALKVTHTFKSYSIYFDGCQNVQVV